MSEEKVLAAKGLSAWNQCQNPSFTAFSDVTRLCFLSCTLSVDVARDACAWQLASSLHSLMASDTSCASPSSGSEKN